MEDSEHFPFYISFHFFTVLLQALLTLPSNILVSITTVGVRLSQIMRQKSSTEFSVGPNNRTDVCYDSWKGKSCVQSYKL